SFPLGPVGLGLSGSHQRVILAPIDQFPRVIDLTHMRGSYWLKGIGLALGLPALELGEVLGLLALQALDQLLALLAGHRVTRSRSRRARWHRWPVGPSSRTWSGERLRCRFGTCCGSACPCR